MSQDIIDTLVGSALAIRSRRPITKEQTQASYLALFESETAGFTWRERFAIALFGAILHRDESARNFYTEKLRLVDTDLVEFVDKAAMAAMTAGPYGLYPDGPLSLENSEGINWQAGEALADKMGRKLVCGLEHAHFLIFHPRDATKDRLELLREAGWDTPSIVTLSQLIAYLSYQLRIAHGLRVLASSPA